jgi:hypothetical protein
VVAKDMATVNGHWFSQVVKADGTQHLILQVSQRGGSGHGHYAQTAEFPLQLRSYLLRRHKDKKEVVNLRSIQWNCEKILFISVVPNLFPQNPVFFLEH